MSPRLDAHAHFFLPGYVGQMRENRRRQSPDEVTLYQAHAQHHAIEQVLAVGYEGSAWAAGNNAYLASLTAQHPWVRPVAYVADLSQLTVAQLRAWQTARFVGISLYLMSAEDAAVLPNVAAEIWQWLSDQAWLISVNSTGEQWTQWVPILTHYPELRLLIAHLGLPPAATVAPSLDEARSALTTVLQLAPFANVYVKFSGFYALAQPGYAFPHAASWPYAQAITEVYGTQRILWASDFSPALEIVSFPQSVEVIANFPWLTLDDLRAINYDNLASLLATFDERNPKS
jgi:L-fuconolactonase